MQRDGAKPLQTVADPVAAELEAALALRRTGADPKVLRRTLRRIEELLDEWAIGGERASWRDGGQELGGQEHDTRRWR